MAFENALIAQGLDTETHLSSYASIVKELEIKTDEYGDYVRDVESLPHSADADLIN